MSDVPGNFSLRRIAEWTRATSFSAPVTSTFHVDPGGDASFVIAAFAIDNRVDDMDLFSESSGQEWSATTNINSGTVTLKVYFKEYGDQGDRIVLTPETSADGFAGLVFEMRPVGGGSGPFVEETPPVTSIEFTALSDTDSYRRIQTANVSYIARDALDPIVPAPGFTLWDVDNGTVQLSVMYADAPRVRPIRATFSASAAAGYSEDQFLYPQAVYPPPMIVARR